MADPVSPPRGGSRQAAMMPESFLFQTVSIIPKMLHVCIEEALGKMAIGEPSMGSYPMSNQKVKKDRP